MNFSIFSSEAEHIKRDRPDKPGIFLTSAMLTALIGLTSLWTLASNFAEGFLAPEYGMWVAKQEWVDTCRFGPTIVPGDSRMVAGVIPATLGGATNLALGGATPIEAYYTVLHASRCANPPKRIVLSFSPAQLMESIYFWPRTALFGYLSYDELEQVRQEARSIGDKKLYSPPNIGDFDAVLTNWLYAHHFPSYFVTSIINGRVIGRLGVYHQIQQEITATGGQHFYGQNNGNHGISEEADMEEFKASPLLDAYFAKMLRLCAQERIQVYYLAAPWNHATYSHLQPGFTDQLASYLGEVAQRFPTLRVIEPFASMDDAYFGDDSHLNTKGAGIFSVRIAASLQNIVE